MYASQQCYIIVDAVFIETPSLKTLDCCLNGLYKVYKRLLLLKHFHMFPSIQSAMAPTLHNYVLALLFIALLPFKAISTDPHHHHGIKSLHFALFQHETINKTGYIVVNGVAGPGISQTTTPFGTIFAFQDPMTATANRSSKVIGIAEGTSITSGFDGLRSISVAKITLRLKKHMGSISIVGGTHNVKPSDHPVVGGTGDFLFVQGYVRSSPVNLKGLTVTYKIEFHLYWPPFAGEIY